MIYPQWFIDMLTDEYKLKVDTLKGDDRVDFICPIHGTYSKRVRDVIKMSDKSFKTGCAKCKMKKSVPKDLLQYFELTELELNTMSWQVPVRVKCSVCGKYCERTISSVIRSYKEGNKIRCKSCASSYASSKVSKESRSKANEERHIKSRLGRFDLYLDEMVLESQKEEARMGTLSFKDPILWKCPNGHEYWQPACNYITLNEGCPMCIPHEYGSKYEDEIETLIHIWKPDIKVERNVRGYIGGLSEIDIYLPDYKLGIEFNDSYWHASLGYQLKEPKSIHYHRDKYISAESNGIHLISIWDVDWMNNKDKIIRYIKSLIIGNKRIYARNCELKEVNKKLAIDFCNKYHLQSGFNKSEINYGLFYNNELLSVMCFGRVRYQKDDTKYELYRYCVKDGYTIVGGAERLQGKFEKENKWTEIITYSDNDYFTGSIYDRLGYEYNGITRERYFWTLDGVNEVRRERAQLKHLILEYPELYKECENKNVNKEDYIMLSLRYRKCYRSGNKKWIKRR